MPSPIAAPSNPVTAAVSEAAASSATAPVADGQFAKVLQGQAAKSAAAESASPPQTTAASTPSAAAALTASATAPQAADPVAAILALLLPQTRRALGAAGAASDGSATLSLQPPDGHGATSKDTPNAVDTAWLPPGQTVVVVAPVATKSAAPPTAADTNGDSRSAATAAADRWTAEAPANLAGTNVKEALNALAGKGAAGPSNPNVGSEAQGRETFQAALAGALTHNGEHQSAVQSAVLASANAATAAVQAAAVPPAPAHSAPALTIAAPVGSAGWSTEVGDKLTWMVNHQEQRADLVLNPPHLGRIEVSLSLSGDQASAIFVSANAAVRDAINSALPHLRELMAGAGVSLGQTQVGAESASQFAQQGQSGDNSWRGSDRDGRAEALTATGAASSVWLGRGRGMVDVFA